MIKKLNIILLLISFAVCLGLMSGTYSRYVADTTGNIDMLFAKWQILVNEADITNSASSSITFSPILESNENIAENKIAPSSKGYFDIDIDPSNVDVSFQYTINLEMNNEDLPDLLLTKYAILPVDYEEGNPLDIIYLNEYLISNTLSYDNDIENFQFEAFTIRVFFEWVEGVDETMNDEADTTAANTNPSFEINANISFEQLI